MPGTSVFGGASVFGDPSATHTSEHGSHARRLARHATELGEVLRGLGKVSRQPQQRRDLEVPPQSKSKSKSVKGVKHARHVRLKGCLAVGHMPSHTCDS
jgi:hypothetical protein